MAGLDQRTGRRARLEAEFQRRLAELSAKAEAATPAGADRGMDEATAETALAQITELRAERDRSALRVLVRQLTDAEVADAVRAAAAADAPESERSWWVLAAACTHPTFTVDQLRRLHSRDVSGEQMVAQLVVAFNSLRGGLPVPS